LKSDPHQITISNVKWWDFDELYTQTGLCPRVNIAGNKIYEDCSVYITSAAPFFGKEFLKVDYEACTGEYCPIVFDRSGINLF
jgi:hypothetical protein